MSSKRISLLDAIRGLSVILMICHHFIYDLVTFLNAPAWFFYNPVFEIFQPIVAGTFILVSGISSRFSRSNVKRGFKVIAAALVVTLVTTAFKSPVIFGILHFLGVSMVFYGLTQNIWEKNRGLSMPIFCTALIVITAFILNAFNPVQANWLWAIGLYNNQFFSADYFPIFPWIFVFLLGTWLGEVIKEKRLPEWFYSANPRFLSLVGRKAFLIYLLHQPVILGIVMLIVQVVK